MTSTGKAKRDPCIYICPYAPTIITALEQPLQLSPVQAMTQFDDRLPHLTMQLTRIRPIGCKVWNMLAGEKVTDRRTSIRLED